METESQQKTGGVCNEHDAEKLDKIAVLEKEIEIDDGNNENGTIKIKNSDISDKTNNKVDDSIIPGDKKNKREQFSFFRITVTVAAHDRW